MKNWRGHGQPQRPRCHHRWQWRMEATCLASQWSGAKGLNFHLFICISALNSYDKISTSSEWRIINRWRPTNREINKIHKKTERSRNIYITSSFEAIGIHSSRRRRRGRRRIGWERGTSNQRKSLRRRTRKGERSLQEITTTITTTT